MRQGERSSGHIAKYTTRYCTVTHIARLKNIVEKIKKRQFNGYIFFTKP